MNNTKNLFDFATKELSQDAFLRWFFENYENPELGPIVVAFINYFSKDQFDSREPFHLKYGDIKGLKLMRNGITLMFLSISKAVNS